MTKVDFTAYAKPTLAVACGKCGAPVGQHCRRPSGHTGPLVGSHAERKAEADRVWLEQGDWPISRDDNGRWYYAVGATEDGAPAPAKPKPAPVAEPPPKPAQASLF